MQSTCDTMPPRRAIDLLIGAPLALVHVYLSVGATAGASWRCAVPCRPSDELLTLAAASAGLRASQRQRRRGGNRTSGRVLSGAMLCPFRDRHRTSIDVIDSLVRPVEMKSDTSSLGTSWCEHHGYSRGTMST